MPTCECGKTVEDWRGARGHVQFTAGEGHGEKGEVPDGWRGLFDEDEADAEEADEGEQQADPDGATDEEVREAVEEAEADSGQSDGSDDGRLKRWLTTPLNELLGGGA